MAHRFLALSLVLVVALSVSTRPAQAATYGFTDNRLSPGFMCTQLCNASKRVDFSFTAPAECSGRLVDNVLFYIWRVTSPVPIVLELRADSGGLPGNILAQGTATPSIYRWWYRLYVTPKVTLQVGQRYHILIHPADGYVFSGNSIYIGFPLVHYRSDMSVLEDLGQGWITVPNADPAFVLCFTDYVHAGQGYCDLPGIFAVYGNGSCSKAGERFLPTSTITARRLSLCVMRKGIPTGNLRVAIDEEATGNVLLDEQFCSPNEVSIWNQMFMSHVFSSPVQLVGGRAYRVYVYESDYAGDSSNYYQLVYSLGVDLQAKFAGANNCWAFSQNATTSASTMFKTGDVLFRFDTDGIEVVRLTSFKATSDGASVVVETNKATDATLEYGDSTSYGMSASSSNKTVHTFIVTGLAPGTTCHYRVHFVDPQDPSNTLTTGDCKFRTDPGNQPIDVTVFGDVQSMDYNAMVALMAQYPHDILVTTGDMVGLQELPQTQVTYDRAWREWRWLLSDITPLTQSATLYTALGNHDDYALWTPYNPAPLQAYNDTTLMPTNGSGDGRYYSFDYGPAHFCILDTCRIAGTFTVDATQLAWADADLRATTKQWKIVSLHVPGYGLAADELVYRLSNWSALQDMYRRDGVQLVLQGHSHVYNRFYKDGVCYITTALPCMWGCLDASQPDGSEVGWSGQTVKPNSGGDWLTIPEYIAKPGWLQLRITPTTVVGAFRGWLGQALDTFGLPYGPPSPPGPAETASVGQTKHKSIGDYVQISGTVTCTENDAPHRVYIQDDLSRSGIWVNFNWQYTTHRGDHMQLTGSLNKDTDELKLDAYIPTLPVTNSGSPSPIALNTLSMGGAASGAWSGIDGALGLATVGSLVRVVGTAKNVDIVHSTFYISDSSNVVADNGLKGAVCVTIAPGTVIPQEGKTYAVTGISSFVKVSNKLYRALLMRDSGDIQLLR